MKYIKVLITREECLMACASCWEFGVYPESSVGRAVAKAKKVALALDRQIPGFCPHEVKEVEVEVDVE